MAKTKQSKTGKKGDRINIKKKRKNAGEMP